MNLPSVSHGRMKIVVSDTTGDPEDSEPVAGLNHSALAKKTPLLERAGFRDGLFVQRFISERYCRARPL
jgi:hypothetical protein